MRNSHYFTLAFALLLSSATTVLSDPLHSLDASFWSHWGDGKAEIAAYDLKHPRYAEVRDGLAVSIFVTENFSISNGTKTYDAHQGSKDVVPVLKLNLVEDFPTGVYDYNIMTSVFSSLEPTLGRGIGSPIKVSFSSQEWCGHVYQQLSFTESAISSESHSYFEKEADESLELTYPSNGVTQDSLHHWARGFSAPHLAPGESKKLPLLLSLKTLRLKHVAATWSDAVFSRSKETQEIRVPAGSFRVEAYQVKLSDGSTLQYFVEQAAPKRIIKWSSSDGLSAELVGSKRMPYWSMKDVKSVEVLKELGVSPRPARTP